MTAATAREQALRVDLACALRWCARLDLHEGVANHFSVAVDDDGGRFLMNRAGRHFSRATPDGLLLLDARDEAAAAGVDATAWCLHGYFHRHVPRARCLMHTHAPYATALACVGGWELLPLDQNACRFFNRVAYDDGFEGMLLADEEAARLARAAAGQSVLVMRGHGVLTVAESVGEAFDLLYYFERACRTMWLAMASGAAMRVVDADVAEKTARQWEAYDTESHFAELRAIMREEAPDVFGN